jgi:hypothetical protein
MASDSHDTRKLPGDAGVPSVANSVSPSASRVAV